MYKAFLGAILAGTAVAAAAEEELSEPTVPTLSVVLQSSPVTSAPENTLAVVDLAWALGVQFVEVDVRTSKDGMPVLMHDATVDRTTEGKGPLRRLTAAELDGLDAAAKHEGALPGQFVPRLADFLAYAKDKVGVLLTVHDGQPSAIAAAIAEAELGDTCLVRITNAAKARAFHEAAPAIRTIIPVHSPEGVRRAKDGFGAAAVECDFADVTPAFQAVCADADVAILVRYSGDDEAVCQRIAESEADYVLTPSPASYPTLLTPTPIELETAPEPPAEPTDTESPEEPAESPATNAITESNETVIVDVP